MTSGFEEMVMAGASAIIAAAMLVLVVIAVRFAVELRKAQARVNALLDKAETRFDPLEQRVREISDNVAAVTALFRQDADIVSDTIQSANETVRHAAELTEERLNEFTALLSVIQEEAEGLFLSTASTIRGVRGGAAAFRDRIGTDLASDDLDVADSADDLEIQEEGDGDDDDPERTDRAPVAAPRIRPRARSRRRA